MYSVNCVVSHVSPPGFMLWFIALTGINYSEVSESVPHRQELRKTLSRTEGSENWMYYNFMNIGRWYEIPGLERRDFIIIHDMHVIWASYLWFPLLPQGATHRGSILADATHIVCLHHGWEAFECRESESSLMGCMETYLTFFPGGRPYLYYTGQWKVGSFLRREALVFPGLFTL